MPDAAVQRNDVDSETSEDMDEDEMQRRLVAAIWSITRITKKVMKRLKKRKDKKLRKQQEKLGAKVDKDDLEDAGGAPEEKNEQDNLAIEDDTSQYQGMADAQDEPVRREPLRLRIFPANQRARGVRVPPKYGPFT